MTRPRHPRHRPRVELLYDVAPVHLLIDTLDLEQARTVLRTIALHAAQDDWPGVPATASTALWGALAVALGAPVVPARESAAHRALTRAAVAARETP